MKRVSIKIRDRIKVETWDQVYYKMKYLIWKQVSNQFVNMVCEQALDQVRGQVWDQIK